MSVLYSRLCGSLKAEGFGDGVMGKSHPQASLEAATLSSFIHKFNYYMLLQVPVINGWPDGIFPEPFDEPLVALIVGEAVPVNVAQRVIGRFHL